MDQNNVDVSIVLPILKRIPLFATLDENLHREIIQHIVLMYYPQNYKLFSEGDPGDALYIIKNGQVEIFKEPQEEGDLPKSLATLHDNDFFGEIALVSEAPRNASARTLTEAQVFLLSKSDFTHLLNTNTPLAQQVSATMINRLKENDKNHL